LAERPYPDVRDGSHDGPAGSGPRHAAVAGRRPPSRAERRPAGLAWLGLVTAVVVAGIAAVGIARLQEYAAERHELRIMLADIEASAWQQNALGWQAIAQPEETATLQPEHVQSHLAAHALAEQLAQRDPDSPEAREVQAAFDDYYHHALEGEFALLARGQTAEAERIGRTEVEPAFERLVTALTAADRSYRLRAIDAAAQARIGTILIVAATALVSGGLVWLQRAGSQAYGRVAHRASHDPLTGLPNRSLLHERTAKAIRHADLNQSSVGLLLIDLDRFKEVNDTLGHHYGDQLLVDVARRMQDALRHGDTVGRLGGDEFAVLLPQIATVEELAATASKIGAALHDPFPHDGLTLTVEASIGGALYPEHGGDVAELLRHADIAMYAAKLSGTGFVPFDRSLGHLSPRRPDPPDDPGHRPRVAVPPGRVSHSTRAMNAGRSNTDGDWSRC
jgi:diguanylate cyclase (GGDEF)-like protein